MGRIRDAIENPLFQSIAAEVPELFGLEDVILYRFDEDLSEPFNDPLWDEYAPGPKYRAFKLIGIMKQPERSDDVGGPSGKDVNVDAQFDIARDHLDKSGLPIDIESNQIRSGDVFMFFGRGDTQYYDTVGVNRRGYVNNSDQWTFLECMLKRREKFSPERKL